MPCVDRERKLARGLADAGEHDLLRRNAGGARAQKLALGDDIGPRPQPRQRRDHRLVGIRLHGVAHERVDVGERAGKHLIVALQRRARIAIERGADGLRQRDEIDRFGVQHAVAIGEVVHGACLARDGGVRYRECTPPAPLAGPLLEQGVKEECLFSTGGAAGFA